jgi:hypothetical protein
VCAGLHADPMRVLLRPGRVGPGGVRHGQLLPCRRHRSNAVPRRLLLPLRHPLCRSAVPERVHLPYRVVGARPDHNQACSR